MSATETSVSAENGVERRSGWLSTTNLTPSALLELLAPAARLLLALAHPQLVGDRLAACRNLLAEYGKELDWGAFIDLASRHKVLPLVARNIVRHRLHEGADGTRKVPYHWLYAAVAAGNRQRNLVLNDEFARVMRGANEVGLSYAIRKGPALLEQLYGDLRVRRMNDLDVLISREEVPHMATVLESLGYQQGKVAQDGRSIEPYDRAVRAFWRMNVNNELPFIRLAHTEDVEVFSIDLCLDIFQAKSEAHADVRELLARRVPAMLCGEPSFTLSMPDLLVDVCTHLFKESTSLFFIEGGSDLQLMKFLDVALLARKVEREGWWPEVAERVAAYNAGEGVYYALHHAALLYPDLVGLSDIKALRPASCDFLDEYGGLDGRPTQWKAPFPERLFDPERRREVTTLSTVPRA